MSTTSVADPVTQAPAALGQVTEKLSDLAQGEWWRATESDLVDVLGAVNRLRHELARVEVHATAETLKRGLPKDRCLSPADYLTEAQAQQGPAPPVGHVVTTVRLAEAVQQVAEGADRTECLQETVAAFDAGVLAASRAGTIVRFHSEVAPHSPHQALATTMRTINKGARDSHGPRGLSRDPLGRDHDPHSIVRRRGWSERELRTILSQARRIIKPATESEREEERGRAFRTLHSITRDNGMTEYALVVEPEAAATIDAAVSALSAPVRGEDDTPDPRTPAQRRADALLTVVRRGVSAPEGVPKTTKAQVMVTIPLADLLSTTQGAGITATGQVLSPGTVRRMACDAGVIPAVLGSQGEILDLGTKVRLFTEGQHRALWYRDQRCTFPACTIPAQWCDAHHVEHWANGGPTNLDNGALLCPRHHTYVHSLDLTATVTTTGVTWHT
ncbi:DUF222 domain-containing protein [Pseudactinotalea sp. Z1748]|uniref:HNH endonuclease signature motif containing protein n=1 Tax=Pseudactinotalea sp. Z1748 TaxID=3413027 RepID=UPI003C7ECFE0